MNKYFGQEKKKRKKEKKKKKKKKKKRKQEKKIRRMRKGYCSWAVREVIRNLKETRSGPCRQGGEECSRQREWRAPRF